MRKFYNFNFIISIYYFFFSSSINLHFPHKIELSFFLKLLYFLLPNNFYVSFNSKIIFSNISSDKAIIISFFFFSFCIVFKFLLLTWNSPFFEMAIFISLVSFLISKLTSILSSYLVISFFLFFSFFFLLFRSYIYINFLSFN